MRVCLMIEGQEGVTWDQWRALATTAEEHGFEALFRSDHYQSLDGSAPQGSLDAWATINALATITSTIRLGTLVSPATFRHPSTLAREVVTADHVSNGRVELGLGAGWHEGEHRSHGFPFETTRERFDRLAEQLEIVHRSWSEDTFDFDGRFYRLHQRRPAAEAARQAEPDPRRQRPSPAAPPSPPAGPTSTTPSTPPPSSARSGATASRRRARSRAATRSPSAS